MFSANVLSENAGQVQIFKHCVHVAKIIDLSSLCFHPKTLEMVGNGGIGPFGEDTKKGVLNNTCGNQGSEGPIWSLPTPTSKPSIVVDVTSANQGGEDQRGGVQQHKSEDDYLGACNGNSQKMKCFLRIHLDVWEKKSYQ